MSVTLKPGSRLFGAACTTEVIVVRAGGNEELTIGGHAPVASADARPGGASVTEGHDSGSIVGKRYVNAEGTLELLCTKAGVGALAVGGALLTFKDAKPLPSSD